MNDEKIDYFEKLPQEFRERFIKEILSRTTPEDLFRLSLVSKIFLSSANSDFVWEKFIPSDHGKVLVARHNRDYEEEDRLKSNKEIFKFLCEVPVTNYRDYTALWLDKWSGKMCFKCSHRDFIITKLDTDYWTKSVFGYPALGHVVWLEMRMKINTLKLSPNTAYTAYLECGLSDYVRYGTHLPIEASVGIPGEEITKESVYFDPDGPLEVKLGDYFNKEGENRDVEIIMKEVKSGKPKCGIHFASIDMRPKRRAIL